MQIDYDENGARVQAPEFAHFIPALLAPLAAKLGRAAVTKLRSALASPPPPQEPPTVDEPELEEEGGVEVDVDADGATIFSDHLNLLNDDEKAELARALGQAVAEYRDMNDLANSVLADALDALDEASDAQDDGTPEFAHFKKKLKKLKKLAKKGMSLVGKFGPLASLVPGLGTALGPAMGLVGKFGSKKGRRGAAQQLVQQALPAEVTGAAESLMGDFTSAR